MIKIKKIFGSSLNGEFIMPERELNNKEIGNIIARWGDDTDYIYFDENDKINNIPEWESYQNHLNQPNEEPEGVALLSLKKAKSSEIDKIKRILGIS